MPLYEYECSACQAEFEALVRSGEIPACPSCGSIELRRLLSGFRVKTEAGSKSAFQKAKEAQKKANRDRVIAERERMDSHHH